MQESRWLLEGSNLVIGDPGLFTYLDPLRFLLQCETGHSKRGVGTSQKGVETFQDKLGHQATCGDRNRVCSFSRCSRRPVLLGSRSLRRSRLEGLRSMGQALGEKEHMQAWLFLLAASAGPPCVRCGSVGALKASLSRQSLSPLPLVCALAGLGKEGMPQPLCAGFPTVGLAMRAPGGQVAGQREIPERAGPRDAQESRSGKWSPPLSLRKGESALRQPN